ncbi:MAG: universal stress protein [Pirellulaceae bacterium]|nr:universal stress protein [Planctomycetales bacterium]
MTNKKLATNKKILLATNYSDSSDQALEFATYLAKCLNAKMTIAHVADIEPYPVGELFDEEPIPDSEEFQRLRRVKPVDRTVKYEHRLLFGQPGSAKTTDVVQALMDFAKKQRVELIVVGGRRRTALGSAIAGSVADALVRRAECPVLTVPFVAKRQYAVV